MFESQSSATRRWESEEAVKARQFSAQEAQLARDFESSKYKREVEGMKEAGLNPMMMYSGGGHSASSPAPQGSTVKASAGHTPGIAGAIASSINSAVKGMVEIGKLAQQKRVVDKDVELKVAQTRENETRAIANLLKDNTWLGKVSVTVEQLKQFWKNNKTVLKPVYDTAEKFAKEIKDDLMNKLKRFWSKK